MLVFKKKIVRLRKNEKGSILIQTALAATVIIGILGIGVDLSIAYLYRAQLSGALDAAALAGAKSFHSETRDLEIQAFFDSNFKADFMDGTVSPLIIKEVNAVDRSLSVTTTGKVDTVFMKIFGHEYIDIAASAETTSKQTGIQLVMVLDNTGSMRKSDSGTIRVDALQTASTTLVNSLFGTDATNDQLEIAILPYVTSVNVGNLIDPSYIDRTGIPDSYTLNTTNNAKWYGCIEMRGTNNNLSASDAYDVQVDHNGVDWAPFLWKPSYDKVYSIPGLNGPGGEIWPAPNNRQHGEVGTHSWDAGPNLNCPAPALNFTSTKADLTTYIDEKLRYSYNRGGTVANVGMVWGWRMLHTGAPFFNNVAYDNPRMVKAAILMTDGYNWVVGSEYDWNKRTGLDPHYDGINDRDDNDDAYDDDGDGKCPKCTGTFINQNGDVRSNARYDRGDENRPPENNGTYNGDYSAYGRRDEGRLDGATASWSTQDAINKRLAYVCSAMKGMGITIYTITFGQDINGSGANAIELRNLYEGCATDSGKYFHAPTAVQLEGSFEAIANDLADLRLSK